MKEQKEILEEMDAKRDLIEANAAKALEDGTRTPGVKVEKPDETSSPAAILEYIQYENNRRKHGKIGAFKTYIRKDKSVDVAWDEPYEVGGTSYIIGGNGAIHRQEPKLNKKQRRRLKNAQATT